MILINTFLLLYFLLLRLQIYIYISGSNLNNLLRRKGYFSRRSDTPPIAIIIEGARANRKLVKFALSAAASCFSLTPGEDDRATANRKPRNYEIH